MNRLAVALLLAGVACVSRAGDVHKAEGCVHINDDSARLACYDAAFGVVTKLAAPAPGPAPGAAPGIAQGAPGGSQAITARPAVEFGDRGQLHKDSEDRAALPKRVDFKVAKVENLRGGLFRLTMDDGQVWATREADWALEFNIGDEVTIQRMLTGGYRVSHKGQARNVTVARIS